MKKLVCCMLVCILSFASVGALAADLQGIWKNYDLFVMSGDGRIRTDNTGERQINGQPIGEIADWYLDSYGITSGGSCKDLIRVAQEDYPGYAPLLSRLANEASGMEAVLIESELYIKSNSSGEDCVWEEYYLMYAAGYLPEGFKEYELIVKFSSELEGGSIADYYVLAEDNGYPDQVDTSLYDRYLGDMRVVNCNEWVSLRSGPSENSPRIAKIPLGAYVNNAVYVNGNRFVYCSYNGQYGYVLLDYLS